MGGHAGGAVAQEHDHAASFLLEAPQRRVHGLRAAEHVADDVGAMQARQHILAVADAAVDERHVLHLVEGRHVGVALQISDLGGDGKFADPLDQLLAHLPVGDEFGDRHALQPMTFGERDDIAGRASRVPLSFISSASTPTAGNPARRHRSTQASV